MTDNDDLYELFAATTRSVLVTVKRDGRPQISNVTHGWYADERVARISVTADRAKTKNAMRDPRVSLYVTREDFWSYAVLEGTAELSPIAREPGDAGVRALVDLYRTVKGEHPDWDDYVRVMIADQRRVLTIRPTHIYGLARD